MFEKARTALAHWVMPRSEGDDDGPYDSLFDAMVGGYYPPLVLGGHRIMTRDLAAAYSAVFRSVVLIAGLCADLVTNSVRVVDRDDKAIKSRHARRAVDLLRESPNGELDAYSWFEDYGVDYLLDGNSVVFGEWVGGIPVGLELMDAWDAYAQDFPHIGNGRVVYAAHPDTVDGGLEFKDSREVVHARWPRVSRRRLSNSRRRRFAAAPIQVLQRTISIGLEQDRYVESYFDPRQGGNRSNMVVRYPAGIETDKETRDEIAKSIQRAAQSRHPTVLFHGPEVTAIKDTAQDADALKLREFQVREIAGRIYGLPAPAVGENVTQWGRGIEQLARLVYRLGVKQHLGRLLAPMSLRLLPRGQRFVIDEKELLRGDMETVAKFLHALRASGDDPLLGYAEFRKLIGYPIERPADAMEPSQAPKQTNPSDDPFAPGNTLEPPDPTKLPGEGNQPSEENDDA